MEDRFELLRKVVLPNNCKCIQRIIISASKQLYLESKAGVVWFADLEKEFCVRLSCSEPVFKTCGNRLLSVTGSVYANTSESDCTEIECPNIEFTDIIKCDNMYILRDNCGNLYRNVNDSYESSKIQIEPPVSFVWKDWTVGFGTYNTKKSLIFISEDLTIWECDLEKEAVEQRQALQTLTHLGSGQFSQNIQPCIYS
eukprot:Platyproteum_vivax@DN6939_c0_g1_i2.p1